MKDLIQSFIGKNVTVYHGSWFDLTDIATLVHLQKKTDAPELVEMATKALNGVIIHTNLGDTSYGLEEMANGRPPFPFVLGYEASGEGCEGSPFYTHDVAFRRESILSKYDRSHTYVVERGQGEVLKIEKFPVRLTLDEHSYYRPMARRVDLRIEGLELSIYYLELDTRKLSELFMELGIRPYLFYESNDGDSDCFRDSFPEAFDNADWLISGRDATRSADGYRHPFARQRYVAHIDSAKPSRWGEHYPVRYIYKH